MAGSRAESVAEVLWELKRADKVASYSEIATRAGFSAGSNGRAMVTCIKTIKKDWPHLEWWRAIRDDFAVEVGTHATALEEWGAVPEGGSEDGVVTMAIDDSLVMSWSESEEANV